MVGDIMVARRVGQAIAGDPGSPFRPLAKRLAGADITVGNLESTLSTDGSPTQGGTRSVPSPGCCAAWTPPGFDLVSLANNHVGDYGDRAMRQTFTRLRAADLDYVGAGRTLAEARRPVVITRDGVRIGFIGTESIGETPAAGARSGRHQPAEHAAPHRPAESRRRCAGSPRHPPAEATGGHRRGDPALGHPVHPSRRAQPAHRRPGLRRPPGPTWSSAATRTGCRAGSSWDRRGRALARQLHLRHGFPGQDPGGDLRGGRALGTARSRRSSRCRTRSTTTSPRDWPGGTPRRSRVWANSRGRTPDLRADAERACRTRPPADRAEPTCDRPYGVPDPFRPGLSSGTRPSGLETAMTVMGLPGTDLDQLRRQAKEWLRRGRSGDPEAIALLRRVPPPRRRARRRPQPAAAGRRPARAGPGVRLPQLAQAASAPAAGPPWRRAAPGRERAEPADELSGWRV